MANETHLLGLFAGEDRQIQFTVLDAADVPVNIAGWVISFSAGVVTKTIGDGVALSDPSNGVVTVTLSPTNTNTLEGTNLYKLWRLDAGFITVLAYGRLQVLN